LQQWKWQQKLAARLQFERKKQKKRKKDVQKTVGVQDDGKWMELA
jgi:hypothetical protein